MKKLLIYGLVAIVIVFMGMMTWIFIRNNENIELTVQPGSAVYLNKGEEIGVPLNHTNPYKSTEIIVKSSNPNKVEISEDMKKLVAKEGGNATITITTTNDNFGPYLFDVYVGTGENEDDPFYINTAEDLAQIGVKEGWTMSRCYRLTADIDLSLYNNGEWKPIGSRINPFGGIFDGNLKTIKNMKITESYDDAGLFAATSEGSRIEGIILDGVLINGSFYNAGAIVGRNSGVIGLSYAEIVNISSINERPDVSVGGIAGSNVFEGRYPQINMCEVVIQNIKGYAYMGGLVGTNSSGVVINSYAHVGNAEVYTGVFGGIAGLNETSGSNKTAIERSYAIIERASGTGIKAGIIGKNNAATVLSEGALFCSLSIEVQEAVGTGNAFANVRKETSIQQLGIKETYTNITETWNFKDIWKMESVARVNFDGNYEPYYGIFAEGNDITKPESLKSAFNMMRENPENEIVYIISESMVLDLGGEAWEPIGNDEHPFRGSVVAKGNVTVVIKNFTVSGYKYGGLFGLVSGSNNIISGITVEDATIGNAYYAGAIVAANHSATIENCKVNNVSVENAAYLGAVAGYNNGTINNVSINDVDNFVRTTVGSSNCETLGVGGAVGINQKSGRVENVSVYETKVAASAVSGGQTAVGGIVGENHGQIENSMTAADIEVSTSGVVYIGGIVGNALSNGEVKLNYSLSVIGGGLAHKNTYVGGIAGNLGGSTKLELCFFEGYEAIGYNVGGLAAIANGTISQCYMKSSLKGVNVGGFAYTTGGTIINSYARGSVEGSKVVAGFTVKLPKSGLVKYCYNSLNFGGAAKTKYAETEDAFRNWSKVFGRKHGIIENCVVVNSGEVKLYVQLSLDWLFIQVGKGGYIEAAPGESRGEFGDFSKFKKDAEFSSTVWRFDINNEPYLSAIPKLDIEEDFE